MNSQQRELTNQLYFKGRDGERTTETPSGREELLPPAGPLQVGQASPSKKERIEGWVHEYSIKGHQFRTVSSSPSFGWATLGQERVEEGSVCGAADPATSVSSKRRTLSNCVISLGQLNGLQTVTLMNRCRSAGKLLFTVSCAPPPHQPNGGIKSSGQQYPSHGPQPPPLVRSFQEETFPVAVSTNRRGSPTN